VIEADKAFACTVLVISSRDVCVLIQRMAVAFVRGKGNTFRILSGYAKFISGNRFVSYDIGQPTSHSHPHLLEDGEGALMCKPIAI